MDETEWNVLWSCRAALLIKSSRFCYPPKWKLFFASQLDHLARMCWLCIGVPHLSIVTKDVTDMGPIGEGGQKWVGVSRHSGPEGYGLTPRRLPAARADVPRLTWTQSAAESQWAELEMRRKEAVFVFPAVSLNSASAPGLWGVGLVSHMIKDRVPLLIGSKSFSMFSDGQGI